MNRTHLLFLAQTLPWPPDGGVQLRSFNVLRLLAREFDVTALCFHRRSAHSTMRSAREAAEALRSSTGAHVEAFPIPQEYSRARWVRDHVSSLVRARPYTVTAYRSEPFRRRLRELLQTGRFGIVHMDSLDLSGYLPLPGASVPLVCVHHNVESMLMRRRAHSRAPWPIRSYFRVQAALLEREERRWLTAAALNVAVSPGDRDELLRIAPHARFTIVPNGVDTGYFRPDPAAGHANEIVFVGGYGWHPNRDALEYFSTSILPLLRSSGCNASVRWLGRAPEHVREEYGRNFGIRLTGYLPDIRPDVQRANCYVVPLRIGGGTRLKILDAWAMGKAVVSTSIGCEGLDVRDGENILVRDTPESFADAVRAVLSDELLRERLGRAARATTETLYDWNVIGRSMIRAYRDTMGTAAPSRPRSE